MGNRRSHLKEARSGLLAWSIAQSTVLPFLVLTVSQGIARSAGLKRIQHSGDWRISIRLQGDCPVCRVEAWSASRLSSPRSLVLKGVLRLAGLEQRCDAYYRKLPSVSKEFARPAGLYLWVHPRLKITPPS